MSRQKIQTLVLKVISVSYRTPDSLHVFTSIIFLMPFNVMHAIKHMMRVRLKFWHYLHPLDITYFRERYYLQTWVEIFANSFNNLTNAIAQRCGYIKWVCICHTQKSGQRLLSKDTTLKYDLTSLKRYYPIYSLTSSQRCGYINRVCICQRYYPKNKGNIFHQKILP